MSDFILARVSQTLAAEQSLETLVRQLLEMLEAVTRMESTYLTRIDTNAQRQQIMFAHNSSEMQIPEGFSVPWDESLCKRALEDQCTFSNDVANRWHSCIAAQELGIATFLSIPVRLADGSLFGTLCATSRQQQPYNLEGEQVMGLFAKLISHYVEKDTLVQQLQAANVALELHSSTDELTQLPNRRALFKQLALRFALMNPLMILVKIIKLRWIHILSYDQMVSRKINNQTTRCANSIFYTTLFTNSAPNYT
ncbi:putative diguanylate cyclase YeaP [Klebsiella pneumoniae]|nr:putative diguanylate cyclase YeaP [Klebsiella pneumoniae]